MILADTSVWVDHLRTNIAAMQRLLDDENLSIHPFVIGEVALGHLNPRGDILHFLHRLPQTEVANGAEVLAFIERYKLFGTGLGFVDVHLLTSAMLSFCPIWTRDKRLRAVAEKLDIAAQGLN